MSALRVKHPILTKTASAYHRLPKPIVVWTPYVIGSVILALALIAARVPPFDIKLFIGSFALCFAAMVLSSWHLGMYPTKGVDKRVAERILWVSSLLAILGLQIGARAVGFGPDAKHEVGPLAVAPLVTVGMLVSGLLGPAKGIYTAALIGVCAVIVGLADPIMVGGAVVTASIGAHSVNPMRQRNDLFRATYVTTLAYAGITLAVALISQFSVTESLWSASWGLAGGVGASALFWFAVAAFERAFGVVSDWSLLELCSPDQGLLRELMLRAPGTYAHSVMVGNLADQAAAAVGANALLCRAMAYYHDIGKMKRPEFFIENKLAENPHDRINPTLSAKIIASHVRDGIKFAEEYRIPKAVQDGINEHHGTSLISYFYHLHSQSTGQHDPVLELHFRYPGPRPRSKETAVLMLADRVEAATRSIGQSSPGRLRAFVWEIVQDVRDDGQLDDSELNFGDLQTIVDSFVSALTALRHERIEYPGGGIEGFEEETSYSDHKPDASPPENANHSTRPHEDAGS